ncbi:MAG: GNAT family N-acetyltransferase [Bacteroidetes bacterium]|nr:GNAT family N-acetyltransferase [Bacteroidota bacterium]
MEIIGTKIKLRAYTKDDYDTLRHWLKGDQEWKKYDGPYYRKPTDEEVEVSIVKQIERDKITIDAPYSLAIADIHTDIIIGEVTRYWICRETKWVAVGILIYDPALWGRGYATEALGMWSDLLFDKMPDSWRFDLETWSGNIGMMRVAEKIGYKLEGRFTNARKVNGKFYDSVRYGKWRE